MTKLLAILIPFLMAFSLTVQGESLFCAKPSSLKEELFKQKNHLSFTNSGGLFNGGICWWHSRFTRNSLYLSVWRPELPRPSADQAKAIIKALRKGQDQVIIPGFDNLYDFSRAYETLIRKELEKWQISDGAYKAKWMEGLLGMPFLPAGMLSNHMDELYGAISRTNDIIFLRVQLQGVAAHAWLVKSMKKTKEGYQFEVLDSNFEGIKTFQYTRGSTSMRYFGKKFIPYLQFTPELIRIKNKANCP